MKVHYGEDRAGVTPAPRRASCSARGRAKRFGQGERGRLAIEPRQALILGAEQGYQPGRQHDLLRYRERWADPARSETPACMDASCSRTESSHPWPVAQAAGPRQGR